MYLRRNSSGFFLFFFVLFHTSGNVLRKRKAQPTFVFFIIIIIMCRTINSRSGHRGGRVVRWSWVNFQCRASYNLDDSRAKAYCACSRCGWGCLDIFTLLYLFSPLSPSFWETARHRLKYCPKRPLNPKQPANQPFRP